MTMPSALNLQGDFETAKALLDAIDVVITIGTQAADVINVSLQVVIGDAQNIDINVVLVAWLTDTQGADAAISSAAPDVGVALGTDGALVAELVANLMFYMVTDEVGVVDLDIEDATGTPTWYLNVALPGGGVAVSDAITFA